jgi:gluconolactonase
MKAHISILAVALLGFLVYDSRSDSLLASSQPESRQLSGPKPPPPNGFVDLLGLVSESRQGLLTTLATGFGFSEGPAVDRHGNVFFTDQPNDRIYRWDAGTDEVTLFLQGTGRANGMAFDADGNLIACADMHGELWKIYPDGTHEVLIDNYEGKLLNGPNDVWINPVDGGMYITDPIFPRNYWDLTDPRRQPWEPTHSEQAPFGKGGYVYYPRPEAMRWSG